VPHPNSPLNARQVEVLQWIAEGSPDGVMKGHTFKVTAVALQNRRLVTISKKGGVWRADATDSGTYYLKHGEHPPTSGQQPGGSRMSARAEGIQRRSPTQVAGSPSDVNDRSTARAPRLPKPLSPTEQLIANLVENGGEVHVGAPLRAKYEARVLAAIRFGKVPVGKQLVTEGFRWSTDFVVRLRDAPAWLNEALESIAIPKTLHQPHEVVVAVQDSRAFAEFDRPGINRALRLTQALVVEAVRRGYRVKATEDNRDQYGYRRPESNDHFCVTVGSHSVGVRFRQETIRTRHDPTPTELERAAKEAWFRIPKYDVSLSQRLSVFISGPHEHRQSKWTDATMGTLEEWLPQVLQEIELRAKAAEEARIAAIAAAEERRRQWEQAMDLAKREFAVAYRTDALFRQVDGWHRVRQVREYLDAMLLTIDAIDDPDDAVAAKEWHRKAEQLVALVDPLARRLSAPAVPEPKADELKPFLNGLSPYGPDRVLGW
jgi:hypothetical protein